MRCNIKYIQVPSKDLMHLSTGKIFIRNVHTASFRFLYLYFNV